MAITIDYTEPNDSPTYERWTDYGGFEAERILRCKWGERHVLANQLRGNVGGFVLSPASYPNISQAIVRDVKMVPEGKLAFDASYNFGRYEYALLRVYYSTSRGGQAEETTVTYDDGNGIVLEETFSPSAEFMTGGVAGLNWSNNPNADDAVGIKEAPNRIVRMLDWTIVQFNASAPPVTENTYAGSVNADLITSFATGEEFAPETLQFLGVLRAISYDDSGNATWTVTHRFQYRPGGWNLFPRDGYVAMQPVYFAGVQYKPYPPIDFLLLSVICSVG